MKSKAQKLWNVQNQSTVFADRLNHDLDWRLVVLCITRWNYLYDALVVLHEMSKSKNAAINQICYEICFATFFQTDKDVIIEYLMVMQPVAEALDILQGESGVYAGILLPTLDILN